jgi:hypothetical protein
MGYVILIGIAIAIIYGLIKLLIFLAPYIGKGLLIVLGIGAVIGTTVGIFYGIRSYWLSINKNINNKALRIAMKIITSVFIVFVSFTIIAIIHYHTGN